MLNQSLNGQLVVGTEVFHISHTGDFNDLLTSTPRDTQFRVQQRLKEVCAAIGERRSAMGDLYRQRLAEMRAHLRMS